MQRNYIARLVVYGLKQMTTKDYRRLIKWLEARLEESKSPEYRKGYADRYVSKLMK